jgi:uncharacterized membrane protein
MTLDHGNSIENLFKHWADMLSFGIEIFAALVIGLAAVEAAVRCLVVFARRDTSSQSRQFIRIHLGRWLALALEFELAADILATAVAPSWDDIGRLAAIIVLRTLLNYFLEREVNQAASQAKESDKGEGPEPKLTVPPPQGVG